MNTFRLFALLSIFWVGCSQAPDDAKPNHSDASACAASVGDDTSSAAAYKTMRGALLGTRFSSLDDLKTVIRIEYDSTAPGEYVVRVRHCCGDKAVTAVLATGISQGDFSKARYSGTVWDRLALLYRCPYAIRNRKDLEKIYTLSRWRPELFGEGDLAFYDIAKASAGHINTPELAFKNVRDSTDKGYLNTFNHVTAQAFMTTCFSEELADFVGDSHERYRHPELITGKFSDAQLADLGEGPVDNYVDLINNEWGQEIGKQLREKYGIRRETNWTPELLADYLNDLERYYSHAFQIGFEPFRPDDAEVVRFSGKINAVMQGHLNFDNTVNE